MVTKKVSADPRRANVVRKSTHASPSEARKTHNPQVKSYWHPTTVYALRVLCVLAVARVISYQLQNGRTELNWLVSDVLALVVAYGTMVTGRLGLAVACCVFGIGYLSSDRDPKLKYILRGLAVVGGVIVVAQAALNLRGGWAS